MLYECVNEYPDEYSPQILRSKAAFGQLRSSIEAIFTSTLNTETENFTEIFNHKRLGMNWPASSYYLSGIFIANLLLCRRV